MWYSSIMPQCSNQRTSERAQLLSAMTHPSTVLDLDANIYIYMFRCQLHLSAGYTLSVMHTMTTLNALDLFEALNIDPSDIV